MVSLPSFWSVGVVESRMPCLGYGFQQWCGVGQLRPLPLVAVPFVLALIKLQRTEMP